ncbi:MAG TPA: ribonuclease III family protein [Candidatus Lokiarchaeia archaeon]|nr:ribonuclease III family protein [Candidatus Lokiarchaeia archaeon]
MIPLNGIKSLRTAARDKGLAQVGDTLVNFVYSVARSRVLGKCTGKRVSRTVLADALKAAELRDLAKTRADAHDLADTVEALVAYAWAAGALTIEEMVGILAVHLDESTLKMRDLKAETAQAAEAFKNLLAEMVDRIGLEE